MVGTDETGPLGVCFPDSNSNQQEKVVIVIKVAGRNNDGHLIYVDWVGLTLWVGHQKQE